MTSTLIDHRLAATSADRPVESSRSDAAVIPRVDRECADSAMDERWIEQVYPSLHRVAWTMTGDPSIAEDLAQETLVRALEQWDRFDGRSSRSTWTHGILIRLARKHFRSLARLRRRIETYVDRGARVMVEVDSAETVARDEWRQSVWAEVARLPRRQAEAITLRFAQQMTYEQIASVVGCAVGTAKTRVHEGIKRLRQSPRMDATCLQSDIA